MRSEGYSSRSVCLFVRNYSCTTGYEAEYERYQQFQCYKSKKNNAAISLKRTAFERYGVKTSLKANNICIMSTGLPRPGLARSGHRGRIKFLWGYVFKSRAALNPLTIT